MKTTRFLFMMMSCGTLLHGISYADPSKQESEHQSSERRETHQTDGKQSDNKRDDNHACDKSDKSSPARAIKATPQNHPGENRAAQVPKKFGATLNLRQPGSSKTIGAKKSGLVEHGIENNHGLPVRAPSAVPPAGLSLKNVSHRGPNPAVLGGLANATKNTAALNGTGMNRKP